MRLVRYVPQLVKKHPTFVVRTGMKVAWFRGRIRADSLINELSKPSIPDSSLTTGPTSTGETLLPLSS